MVEDARFDSVCYEIDLSMGTGNADMDSWWEENFAPHTGSWIHAHPELGKVKALYGRMASHPGEAENTYDVFGDVW
jgi:hypothetical protein